MQSTIIEFSPTKILKESKPELADEILQLSKGFSLFPSDIFTNNPQLETSIKQVINQYLKINSLIPLGKLKLNFLPFTQDFTPSPLTLITGLIVLNTETSYPYFQITLNNPNKNNFYKDSSTTSDYIKKLIKGDILIFDKSLDFTINSPSAPIIMIEILPK
jgi:hypothetical protein